MNRCAQAVLLGTELGLSDLLAVRRTSRFWREVGSDAALWRTRLADLWRERSYIAQKWRALQAEGDAFAAYSGSCRARRQRWVTPEELQELSPWNFRFKRAAGQAWLSMDPYWQGEECLTVTFHPDGRYTRHSQDGGTDISEGRWRFVQTVGTGQRGPIGAFLRMSVDDFSVGQGGLGQWYKTVNEPAARAFTGSRADSEPLLEPEPEPLLEAQLEPEPEPAEFTLASTDLGQEASAIPLLELPTFHVTRHPEHWGIVLESCWSLMASFPHPPVVEVRHADLSYLRVTVAMQWGEVDAFNRGDPLDGTIHAGGDALDDVIAARHGRFQSEHSRPTQLLKVGSTTYRFPRDVLKQILGVKAKQERGDDVDDETEGWMLELLELMQLQADAEAVEEEQSILQTEMLNPEEQGIFFVDGDSDDGNDGYAGFQ